MLPQQSLKLTGYVMLFYAFSWRYFLKKKSIWEKFKTQGISKNIKDYKDFLQFYHTVLA